MNDVDAESFEFHTGARRKRNLTPATVCRRDDPGFLGLQKAVVSLAVPVWTLRHRLYFADHLHRDAIPRSTLGPWRCLVVVRTYNHPAIRLISIKVIGYLEPGSVPPEIPVSSVCFRLQGSPLLDVCLLFGMSPPWAAIIAIELKPNLRHAGKPQMDDKTYWPAGPLP